MSTVSSYLRSGYKGQRQHGKPAVLAIDAKRMQEDGIKFFLSRNGVWLTDFVDAKYIIGVAE